MRSGGALLVLASLAATGSALLESRSLALAPSVCAFTGRASSEDCRSCIGKGPCGYCADDDSCREGSLLGAQWGGACASWNYETCAAVPSCHEKTDCAGCAASPRCGWCASSDAYKTGCFPFDRDDAPRAGESLGSKVSFHAPNKCAGGPWVQRDLFAGGADEVADTCSGRPTRSEAIEAYEAKLLREKNNPSLGGARAAVGSGRAGNAGTESVSGSGSGSGSGSETVAETRYASSTGGTRRRFSGEPAAAWRSSSDAGRSAFRDPARTILLLRAGLLRRRRRLRLLRERAGPPADTRQQREKDQWW